MADCTLRQHAYRQLRGLLISGKLGPGSVISEPSLATRLKMSRTPVREALDQLALEGIVERVARYGTVVRSPSRRELNELCVVREELESMAARTAAEQISAGDLELLGRLCEALRETAVALRSADPPVLSGAGLTRFRLVDMGFHEVLVGASGNSLIVKFVGQAQLMSRVFALPRLPQDLRGGSSDISPSLPDLPAIVRRDAEAAHRWTREHLRLSRERHLAAHDAYRQEAEEAPCRPLPSEAVAALGWNEHSEVPPA